MRNLLIKICIRLLRYLSRDRIGIIYHTEREMDRRRRNSSAFDVVRKEVTSYYGVPFTKMVEKCRRRKVLEPRQMFHFLAYKYSKMSTAEIGALTNLDHATVLHSMKVTRNLIDTEPAKEEEYNILCKNIENRLVTIK